MAAGQTPVAHDDYFTVPDHVSWIPWDLVLANDTDADSAVLTGYFPMSSPAHGVISFDFQHPGRFGYSPNAGYQGPDAITYNVGDPENNYSDPATIHFLVVPNKAPVGASDLYDATANSTLVVTTSGGILRNDTDPDHALDQDILMVSNADTTPPAHGTLTMNADSRGGFSGWTTVTLAVKPTATGIVLGVPHAKPGQGVYLISRISAATSNRSGVTVTAYLDGKKVTSRLTDFAGTAKIPLKLPSLAGKHSIKVVADSKSATKSFTYGKGVTAKLAKLSTIKRHKTATIKGSFGYKSGKITLRITDPKGKTVSKTVKLSSTGKFTYKYRVSSVKGTWTVRYSYNASSKYYGAKGYKLSFKVK